MDDSRSGDVPLIARLLLDAQSEFMRTADAVPPDGRTAARPGLNAPAWVIAHAGFFHDCWMNGDAQGRGGDALEPWLRSWFQTQRAAGASPIETSFDEARAALDSPFQRATTFVTSLDEPALVSEVGIDAGFAPGTTVGCLVARDIAHLWAHASELNLIAVASGAADRGLPGRMEFSAGRPLP
jgi:hypothetical protein